MDGKQFWLRGVAFTIAHPLDITYLVEGAFSAFSLGVNLHCRCWACLGCSVSCAKQSPGSPSRSLVSCVAVGEEVSNSYHRQCPDTSNLLGVQEPADHWNAKSNFRKWKHQHVDRKQSTTTDRWLYGATGIADWPNGPVGHLREQRLALVD